MTVLPHVTDSVIFHGNENHSRRADVSVFSRENVVAKAHEHHAAAITRCENANAMLVSAFRALDASKEELREIGSLVQEQFPPMLDAAYSAWSQHGDKEERLELAHLTPAPLPPEGE